jgi:nitrite reductase (cytochrome c-552)
MRNRAMAAGVALIGDLKVAKERGATAEQLAPGQDFHRQAQFLFDFVEAENSTGFHAPQEAARLLAQSIDLARQGQLIVRQIKDHS